MPMKDDIDRLLDQAVKAGEVPGVAAMVATSEATLYSGGFGERRLCEGAAMTTDTVVAIASMT
jgi:CubicO group peptidase (beta-lactamase class C family)